LPKASPFPDAVINEEFGDVGRIMIIVTHYSVARL
jgi:hypothetical protein